MKQVNFHINIPQRRIVFRHVDFVNNSALVIEAMKVDEGTYNYLMRSHVIIARKIGYKVKVQSETNSASHLSSQPWYDD